MVNFVAMVDPLGGEFSEGIPKNRGSWEFITIRCECNGFDSNCNQKCSPIS